MFGLDAASKKINRTFKFDQNNFTITSVDIQSVRFISLIQVIQLIESAQVIRLQVEPVDQRTRDALQKSVQLAIEITIQSQVPLWL